MFLFVETYGQYQVLDVVAQTLHFCSPSLQLSYRLGIHHVAQAGSPSSPRNCPVLASAVLGFQTWGYHRQYVYFKNQNKKQKHAFWGPNLVG